MAQLGAAAASCSCLLSQCSSSSRRTAASARLRCARGMLWRHPGTRLPSNSIGSGQSITALQHLGVRNTPRGSSSWSVAAANGDGKGKGKGSDEREPAPEGEREAEDAPNAVSQLEVQLGKSFGGVLWFGVLAVSLAVFGGGYAFLIYNYADYADIPMLRSQQRQAMAGAQAARAPALP